MPDFFDHAGATTSVEGDMWEEGPDADNAFNHFLSDPPTRTANWQGYFAVNARSDYDQLVIDRATLRATQRATAAAAVIDCPKQIDQIRNGQTTRRRTLDLDGRRYGPRIRGRQVYLKWSELDPNLKVVVWNRWFDAGYGHGPNHVTYDSVLAPGLRSQYVDPGPGGTAGRTTVSCKSIGLGLAGLVGGLGAIGGIIYGFIHGAQTNWGAGDGASPVDLKITTTRNGEDLTVNWTSETVFAPASPTDSFTITLTNQDTRIPARTQSVAGTESGAVFEKVAAGTYDVTVSIPGAFGRLAGVVVAMASPVVTTTEPDATALVLAEVAGTPGQTPGIAVSWTAPASANGLTGYVVSYERQVVPAEQWADVNVGIRTNVTVPAADTGTYKVTVTAKYGLKSSKGLSGTVTVNPATAVDAPSNIAFFPYRSVSASTGGTGQAGLVIEWDAPTTGSWIDSFDVTVTATPTGSSAVTSNFNVCGATQLQLEGTVSGAFQVSVVSRGLGATSNAATGSYNLDTSTIDQNSPDLSLYLSKENRDAWVAANVKAPTNEAQLWADAQGAVADTSGTLGGVASLQQQLELAIVLTSLLSKPVDPSFAKLDQLADWLVAAAKFPTGVLSAGSATNDGLALWKAAETLANPATGTTETLRFRLLAIRQCLDRYLNGDPRVARPAKASQRVYSLSSSPVESVLTLTTATAGITAQRFVFACAGTITGVWWYRIANDKPAIDANGVVTLHRVYAWTSSTAPSAAAPNEGAAAVGTDNSTVIAGWVYTPFVAPLAVVSNDELIVGVSHPSGDHGRTYGLMKRPMNFGCLSSPADAKAAGKGNGLYHYTTVAMSAYFDTDRSAGYFVSPEFVPA